MGYYIMRINLNKILISLGISIIFSVVIFNSSPRIYKHIYNTGWEDAELYYQVGKYSPPPTFQNPKYKNKMQGIDI